MLAILTVNSNSDVDDTVGDGFLTLREALAIVNHRPADLDNDNVNFLHTLRPLSQGVQSERAQINDATEPLGVNDTILLTGLSGQTILLVSSGVAGPLLHQFGRDLSIVGPGSGLLTIDGGNARSLFAGGGAGTALSISGITFARGQANDGGAMVLTGGQITLSDLLFRDNHAGIGGQPGIGGAILLTAETAVIEDCVFSGNSASLDGGAFYLSVTTGGSCEINNSRFDNNEAEGSGGAIYASTYNDGQFSITESQVIENDADVNGGGIYIRSGYSSGVDESRIGNFTLEESVVAENTAGDSGGGIYLYSNSDYPLFDDIEYRFSRNSITDNTAAGSGGGICIESIVGSENKNKLVRTIIEDCTIAENEARGLGGEFGGGYGDAAGGGGIALFRSDDSNSAVSFELINSTISGNKAESGGGLLLDGRISVRHSTIAFNQAGIDRETRSYTDPNTGLPGTETEHAGGGGIMIRNANLNNQPSRLPTFSHTIVARNSGTTSPNIGVHYNDGWAEDIFAYWDDIYSTDPDPVYLSDICLRTDPKLNDDDYVSPSHREYLLSHYLELSFDYSIIDDRSGPLDECHLPNEDFSYGRLMKFGGAFIEVDKYTGSDPEMDPLILPLRDNGGFTLPDGSVIQTHALPGGSRAVDAGDPAHTVLNPPVAYDQRGAGFARVYDVPAVSHGPAGPIDVGAFEFNPDDQNDDADFNDDGRVDGADFLAWQRGFGTLGASQSQGDADGDTDVDGDDLAVWKNQFGQATTVAAVVAVPSGPNAAPTWLGVDAALTTSETTTSEAAAHPTGASLRRLAGVDFTAVPPGSILQKAGRFFNSPEAVEPAQARVVEGQQRDRPLHNGTPAWQDFLDRRASGLADVGDFNGFHSPGRASYESLADEFFAALGS